MHFDVYLCLKVEKGSDKDFENSNARHRNQASLEISKNSMTAVGKEHWFLSAVVWKSSKPLK